MRTCIKCHKKYPDSFFRIERGKYVRGNCRGCRNDAQREAYRRHREARLESVKAYYWEHREAKLEYAKKWAFENRHRAPAYALNTLHNLRTIVFEAYGGKCACCGEKEILFLTMDHIAGNGNKHRKEALGSHLKAGVHTYRWLKKNGFPKGFQVLCFNCNMGRHRNKGTCPHKRNG